MKEVDVQYVRGVACKYDNHPPTDLHVPLASICEQTRPDLEVEFFFQYAALECLGRLMQ